MVAISAIGTNRASSVALVHFSVVGKDTAGRGYADLLCYLRIVFSQSRSNSKLF